MYAQDKIIHQQIHGKERLESEPKWWKSIVTSFYNKINKVLRCHYFATFTNVEESAVAFPANTFTALAKTSTSTSTSSSPKGFATSSDVANHEKTLDNVQKEQRQHKKRQNTAAKHEDSAIASTMEGVKSKGIN